MITSWALLANIIGIAVTAIIIGFAGVVAWRLAVRSDSLNGLIEEPDGKASLSRFQFLIFTFVVAGLFLLLSIESGAFVEVPPTVLGLIGISGGSFIVSKSISKSGGGGAGGANAGAGAPPPPPPPVL